MARLSLLLLTDSRFPAGTYAHSGGLEAAVAEGLGVAEVSQFLRHRLDVVSRPECILMRAALAAARGAELETLLLLDGEAEARNSSPPVRIASRRLGAQLLRSAAAIWPQHELIASYRAASVVTPRPVAFAVVAAATSLDDLEAVDAYLYEEAAMVAAAAVRLLPVDAAQALRWLADSEPTLSQLAEEVLSHCCYSVAKIPSVFAPLYELRALAHARRDGRLFAS